MSMHTIVRTVGAGLLREGNIATTNKRFAIERAISQHRERLHELADTASNDIARQRRHRLATTASILVTTVETVVFEPEVGTTISPEGDGPVAA